ncbi:hypothetical protein F5X68DRAFT_54713 [Plectosphaerella plurivora]|uniref:Uncharacterized protein n=1 Tax=Plectosphaerella plurivora TaxID=936078 RepID=A0A9P9A776_9PEZI|nr:hypothetical protein F5X68DRAFT_54713 [Plectosphaerella plurivora]
MECKRRGRKRPPPPPPLLSLASSQSVSGRMRGEMRAQTRWATSNDGIGLCARMRVHSLHPCLRAGGQGQQPGPVASQARCLGPTRGPHPGPSDGGLGFQVQVVCVQFGRPVKTLASTKHQSRDPAEDRQPHPHHSRGLPTSHTSPPRVFCFLARAHAARRC